MFVTIAVLNANTFDLHKMSHSVVSDLDQHCLPMSFLWDCRHKNKYPLIYFVVSMIRYNPTQI